MHVVAILEAAADPQNDAGDLARILGLTALEVRMALSAVPPTVLLRTASRERADDAAGALVARGHQAIAVDLADVVPVERMVHVHRFALDAKGLRTEAPGDSTLAYGDIAAIIRVAATTSVVRRTREKEIEPVRGRTTEVEVERTGNEHLIEHALFLFAHGAGIPWVLRAGEARYLGLGAAMRPTAMENFLTVVRLLRERAPGAAYDERFVAHPLVRQAPFEVRGRETATPELGGAGVDVRVHLLALAVARSRNEGPYR